MIRFNMLFYWASALFLIACGTGRNISPQFIDDPVSRVDMNKVMLKGWKFNGYTESPVITVLEKVVYRLEKDNRLTLEVHQVSKVMKDGQKGPGKSFIYFRDGYERVSKVEAYTITPDKKRVEATNIVTSRPFYNHMMKLDLYQDIKVMTITMPRVRKGSLLSVRYQMELEYPDLKGVVEGEFYLANRYPILTQKGVIIVPKGKKLRFTGIKTKLKPRKVSRGDMDYYVVEKENVRVVHSEPFQPAFQELSPRLAFTTLKDWGDMSKRVYALLSTGLKSSDEVTKLANALCSEAKNKKEKVKILYNYVTDTRNISNAAIPLGMAGFHPTPSQFILKLGYADAKDKAALLANMLKAVGIESYLCLTNENYPIDSRVPSLKNMNRILLAVKLDGD
ncbi:MAG: DUF3857 domain-containing protein, partial [Spirochaetota bacterium]|nr:DUF3857 domain-containing protein [Spirochaetota bacterium]